MIDSGIVTFILQIAGAILIFGLFCSTIVEIVAALINKRARVLRAGVQELVNDPKFDGLAKILYEHPLVQPRHISGRKFPYPSYIDPYLFAGALMDVTGISALIGAAALGVTEPAKSWPTVAALREAIDAKIDSKYNFWFKQLLIGITERSTGNPLEIRREIATWFERGMDRVSGVYKRWAQFMSFVVGLTAAVIFNINAISVMKYISMYPTVDSMLKDSMSALKGTDQKDQIYQIAQYMTLKSGLFPLGWPLADHWSWFALFSGWLLTSLTSIFGAPLWFDVLQKMAGIRGTGASPLDKLRNKGAV